MTRLLRSAMHVPERHEALRRTGLLDAPPAPALERLTRLAARLLGAPTAVVTLVDADRQFFASCLGLPEPWNSARETALTHSFCRHVVEAVAPLVVADAREHPLVRENLATRDLGVIAYLGVPLTSPEGEALGAVAVIDGQPRAWGAADRELLEDLAASVATEIALRAEVRQGQETARALADREARFRALSASAPLGIFETDAAGAVIYVNERLEQLWGLPADAFGSPAWLERVHPQDRERLLAACAEALATDAEPAVECRVFAPDGRTRWLRARSARRCDAAGQVLGIVGTVEDVTERRLADAALARSEGRLAEAQRVARVGSWELDVDTETVWWSAELYRLFGRDPSLGPLPPDRLPSALDPSHQAAFTPDVAGGLAGRPSYERDHRVVRPDGTERVLRFSGEIQRHPDGRPCRIVGTAHDVTALVEATGALRASEQRFRDLVESAHEGVWVVDPAGHTTYVNPRLAAMLGHPADAMFGRAMFDYMDADAADEARTLFARRQRGVAESHEFRFRRADGGELWATVSASPLYEADGAFAGALALVSDDTNRRRAERLAARQAAVLEMIAAGRPLAGVLEAVVRLVEEEAPEILGSVLLLDVDGRHLRHGAAPSLSAAYTDAIDGVEIGPAVGSCGTAAYTRTPVVAEDIATDPLWADYRDVAAAHGLRSCWSTPIMAADGAVLGTFALYQRTPARPSETHHRLVGFATHLAGIALERARAEVARVRSERHFRALVEHASDMIAVLDAAGVHRYASPAHARYVGYSPAELVGHDAFELIHPDDRPAAAGAFAGVLEQSGRTVAVQFRHRHADGGWRTLSSVAANLLDDPAVGGVVVNSQDVTDQRALEAQLRQSQKMEAVGQLAGGVAHDFNNLLMVITASTRFAREALPPGTPAHEDLAAVEEAAGRAVQLTRQLLAFSRKQLLKPEVLDLNAVVRGVEPMLRRLIGEDVAVLTIPAPALRPVLADPGQLEQVLVNLAVNARDAMPQGGRLVFETANVEVTPAEAARRGTGGAPGAYVRLTVRDTGGGMDVATLAQIFEPFFTTKAPGKGTGLGLATVYGIVKQSGGHISVSSTPGEGTAFEIDLPAAVAADGSGAAGAVTSTPAPRTSGTVLLVEDEAGVRAVVRRVLSGRGYTVLEAAHGRDALRLVAAHDGRVDLVVTDVVMPEMSGRALAERLADRHPEVRVLFMSGYTDDEILRRGLLLSGAAFLEKPFTAERLLDAVRDALGAPADGLQSRGRADLPGGDTVHGAPG